VQCLPPLRQPHARGAARFAVALRLSPEGGRLLHRTVSRHGWVRQAFTKRSLVRRRTTPICDGRLEAAEPPWMGLRRVL